MSHPVDASAGVMLSDLPGPHDSSATRAGAKAFPWVSTWIILLSASAVAASLIIMAGGAAVGRGFVPVLATAVCLLAALFDAWTTRIPNPLTYTAILLGLGLNLAAWACAGMHLSTVLVFLAAPGWTQSLLGFAVCGAIALAGIFFRIGGGDLKLLAAVGALLGLYQLMYVLLVALGVAVVYSLLNLIILGRLNRFARMLSIRLLEMFYLRRLGRFEADEKPMPARLVPMGVPLAIALLLSQIVDLRALLGGPG